MLVKCSTKLQMKIAQTGSLKNVWNFISLTVKVLNDSIPSTMVLLILLVHCASDIKETFIILLLFLWYCWMIGRIFKTQKPPAHEPYQSRTSRNIVGSVPAHWHCQPNRTSRYLVPPAQDNKRSRNCDSIIKTLDESDNHDCPWVVRFRGRLTIPVPSLSMVSSN